MDKMLRKYGAMGVFLMANGVAIFCVLNPWFDWNGPGVLFLILEAAFLVLVGVPVFFYQCLYKKKPFGRSLSESLGTVIQFLAGWVQVGGILYPIVRNGIYAALGSAAVLVALAEGVQPFALWNLLPLVVAGLVQHRAGDAFARRFAGSLFGIATITVVALAHLAWVFDWGGSATGSSTAGLLFVTLPVMALFAGAVAYAAGLIVAVVYARANAATRHAPGPPPSG